MCGFHITVTQMLCFKLTGIISGISRITKSKLIKCPKIAHTLKLTFNELEDFNKKFATLDYYHSAVEDLIVMVNQCWPLAVWPGLAVACLAVWPWPNGQKNLWL